jgi:hypothetical protein
LLPVSARNAIPSPVHLTLQSIQASFFKDAILAATVRKFIAEKNVATQQKRQEN